MKKKKRKKVKWKKKKKCRTYNAVDFIRLRAVRACKRGEDSFPAGRHSQHTKSTSTQR